MSVKITDTKTSSGKQFEKMLKELSKLEVRVGFQSGETTEDGVDICEIAALNELGTEDIPSRPFLRRSVDENVDKINAHLKNCKNKLQKGTDPKQVLNEIGAFQKGFIQAKIVDQGYVANATLTARKKKSDKPLIDTGRMRQSVNFVIVEKGVTD